MLILAVDTSTRTGSAAVLRDAEVLAEISESELVQHSTSLFHDISFLQQTLKLNLGQIDLFAVSAGPGSFTGLRVGLTAVKAWAEVYRKPVAAVSGLEAIAAESLEGDSASDSGERLIAPFFDARRGQIFGAIYRRTTEGRSRLELIGDELVLSIDEFFEMVREALSDLPRLVSPTPSLIPATRLAEVLPGTQIVQVSPALAPAIGRLGYEKAMRGAVVDALHLDANYVRRSDAESAWKDG
jgi:tRNA threonylcarbamoyladenosine biosynthesis protein TsaB